MRPYIKPKKKFGQHFLVSKEIASNIVELIRHHPCKNTLEIGPGKGILTQFLRNKDVNFQAIEIDQDAIIYLRSLYPELSDKIIHFDFLQYDISTLFNHEPFIIIGNFPYNISSQILFKTIEYRDRIPLLVGMFQKEVAERINAKPGNKSYGVITIFVQLYYDCEYLFTLSENEFSPPPKVKSAVIRLTRNTKSGPSCNATLFHRVIKQTFQQRRKMLRNSLKVFIDTSLYEHPLFDKRPETLSIGQFEELTNFVELSATKNQ